MRQQFVGNKFRPSRIPGKPDARAIVSVSFGEVGGKGTKNTTVPAGTHPPSGCGVIENGCFEGSGRQHGHAQHTMFAGNIGEVAAQTGGAAEQPAVGTKQVIAVEEEKNSGRFGLGSLKMVHVIDPIVQGSSVGTIGEVPDEFAGGNEQGFQNRTGAAGTAHRRRNASGQTRDVRGCAAHG